MTQPTDAWPMVRDLLSSGPLLTLDLVEALMGEYDVGPTEALAWLWDQARAGRLVEGNECRMMALTTREEQRL